MTITDNLASGYIIDIDGIPELAARHLHNGRALHTQNTFEIYDDTKDRIIIITVATGCLVVNLASLILYYSASDRFGDAKLNSAGSAFVYLLEHFGVGLGAAATTICSVATIFFNSKRII